MNQETKIPTNKGDLTIPGIFDVLMWGSYQANRNDGVSHEVLVKWKIGNEAMKIKYETEKIKDNGISQRNLPI